MRGLTKKHYGELKRSGFQPSVKGYPSPLAGNSGILFSGDANGPNEATEPSLLLSTAQRIHGATWVPPGRLGSHRAWYGLPDNRHLRCFAESYLWNV